MRRSTIGWSVLKCGRVRADTRITRTGRLPARGPVTHGRNHDDMTLFALLATSALCAAALLAARRRRATGAGAGAAGVRASGKAGVRRRRLAVSGVVVLALVAVAVGCAPRTRLPERRVQPRPPRPPPAAPAGDPVELVDAPLTWGDGLDHVVVYADDELIGERLPAGQPGARPAGLRAPTAAAGARTTVPPGDQTTEVHRLDGAVESIVVPAESLVAVPPATDLEAELVRRAIAGGAPVALVVVDRTGVAGPAGHRYLLTGHRLDEIGHAIAPSTTSTTGTSVTADPLAADGRPRTHLVHLSAVPGVVSVRHVAPGVAAVSTAAPR